MGPVHDLHNFPIDISGQYSQFFPAFIKGCRGSLQIGQFAFGLAPFSQSFFSHFKGNFIKIPIHCFAVFFNRSGHIKVRCDLDQSFRRFDRVIFGFFSGHRQKDFGHRTSVIRMGCGAGRHHAGKISGRDGVCRSTAQPFSSIFTLDSSFGHRQAARSHSTVFTAGSLHSDIAGFHGHRPVKNRLDIQLLSPRDHFLSRRIDGSRYGIRHLFRLYNFC